MSDEYLLLKWGTLKGWNFVGNEPAMAAAKRYNEAGSVSLSVMSQDDNEAQKQAICDIIDAVNGPITNDWSGEKMSKQEAKDYIRGYGK